MIKPYVIGLPQQAKAVRSASGISMRGRCAATASRGAMMKSCRNRKPATMATRTRSKGQRVSSTSSLRMFWTVSKPISGTSSAKVRRAVMPVWRKAPARSGLDEETGISHLFDVGPAEDALRQEDHHDDENRKGGHVLIGARYVFG